MDQHNKQTGFPVRNILIPALKVGALSGKPNVKLCVSIVLYAIGCVFYIIRRTHSVTV